MRNISKKWLAACMAVMLLVSPNFYVFASEPAARNLSVFRVDGDDATLARTLHGRATEPREGQRLSPGNVMQTGLDTQVYMQLDTASIVKQDELTYVAVAAAGNLLTLSVLRGGALVEVRYMEPGQTLETRIGSTVMSVRGTIFTASIRENGATVITMLSGEGAVFVPDETGAFVELPLEAGYVFWGHDDEADEAFVLRPIDPQAMSLFELREVQYRSEYLLRIGVITPAMQAQLSGLINNRQTERDNRHQTQLAALADLHTGTGAAAQVDGIVAPAPAFDLSGLVWIVEPTLTHESISHCDCGYFRNENWMLVDPLTGNLTGAPHLGHGPWLPMFVFDREQNRFGHTAIDWGYFNLIGLHPYAQALQRFPDIRNLLMIVENVNSNLGDYWMDPFLGSGWGLWPDAYLGEFAVMYNGRLVTDFVFNDRGRFWSMGTNTIAARRGAFWGLIDQQGNDATSFIFEHIVPIDNNTAFARIGGRYGILDIRASVWDQAMAIPPQSTTLESRIGRTPIRVRG